MSEQELDNALQSWIEHAQDMVEGYVEVQWNHTYTGVDKRVIKSAPPQGVQNAVLRIVANMVAQAKIRRQTGVLNISEYRQTLMPDTVFTKSIKEDLEVYIGGGKKHMEDMAGARDRGFKMFAVRNPRRLKEEAAWYPTYDRRR